MLAEHERIRLTRVRALDATASRRRRRGAVAAPGRGAAWRRTGWPRP